MKEISRTGHPWDGYGFGKALEKKRSVRYNSVLVKAGFVMTMG
jgi:hypothetical protein